MDQRDVRESIEIAELKVIQTNTLTRVNEIADRLGSMMADHESRIRIMERSVDQFNPVLRAKQTDELLDWLSEWRGRLAGIMVAAGTLAAAVSFGIELLNIKV